MGMPQIPEGTHRPDPQEAVVDLLESIALEEMALSHLLNAQGEKSQALVKQFSSQQISYGQMMEGFQLAQQMINSIIMNQWLLYAKLGTVVTLPHAPSNDNGQPTCPTTPINPKEPMPVQCQRCRYQKTCQFWKVAQEG